MVRIRRSVAGLLALSAFLSAVSIVRAADAPPASAAGMKVLELTVVGLDGKPAGEVKLTVNADGLNPAPKLKTDAQGVARVEYPEKAKYVSVGVEAGKATVPVRLSWGNGRAAEPLPEKYTLNLEPGTEIKGKVVDDAGNPIKGASVMLSVRKKDPAHPERSANISFKKLTTRDGGVFSYPRVPAEFDEIQVGVFHHGYLSTYGSGAAFYSMNKYENVAGLRDGSATFTLKRGPIIEGVVRGSDGKPVEGAGVGFGKDRVASNVLPEVKTDKDGKFAHAAHSGESVMLTIKAKAHAPEIVQFLMPADGKKLEVALKGAQTLAGRVVDSSGKPLADAWIFVEGFGESRTVNARLRSDADGKFTWTGAPAVPVQADVQAEGFARSSGVTLTPGKDNTVTLIKAAVVRGTVVDAETGKPVPSFQLVSGIDFGGGRAIHWQRQHGLDERQAKGKDGKFELTFAWPYPGHAVRVEADGYLPGDTPVFKIADGDQNFEIKLRKASQLAGRAVDAQGKPVAGVDVILLATQGIQLQNGKTPEHDRGENPSVTTAADGTFKFPPQTDRFLLIATGDAGYGESDLIEPSKLDASKPLEVKVQPWGRIEGVVMIGTKPAAGAKVQTWENREHRPNGPNVFHQFEAPVDKDGKFVIPRIKSGEVRVGRFVQLSDNMTTTTHAVKVDVKPGETQKVQIGGKGRPVVGRLELPHDLQPGGRAWVPEHATLNTRVDRAAMERPPVPEELKGDPEKLRAWYEKWKDSDEGKAYAAKAEAIQDAQKHFPVKIERPNGTFRIDDVEPGTYTLSVSIADPPAANQCGTGEQIATGSTELTVAEVPGGVSDEPMEIPSVALKVNKTIKVGDAAPAWEAKTLDGKPLRLADFKGKYVLLDFWATWCGPCVAETPNLKQVYDAFAKDERFAMVALSLDENADAPKKYAESNGIKWTQGFLGEWSKTDVPASYGVRGIPSMWLIGPDGKVIAKDLRGAAIEPAIRKAMESEPRAAAR